MSSSPQTSQIELLGQSEVADIFKVSVRTVSRWAITGQIPKPARFGGRPYWRVSELNAVITHAKRRKAKAYGS